jgi:hypothetical protein
MLACEPDGLRFARWITGNGESMSEQELSRPRLTRSVDEACHVLWNGVAVGVTARAVPRYAWTTVSIDVAVDATTILRTGGAFKFVGTRVEKFMLDGKEHTAELVWSAAKLRSFPIKLSIDGSPLLKADVPVKNWWLSQWPLVLIVGAVAWDVLS